MKRSTLFLVLLILFVLPLSVAFAQSDDTIVVSNFGNVTSLNPAYGTDGPSLLAWSMLWPAPFETDGFTAEVKPGLTSWTISDDNLTYTFKIRDDAYWSDGKPIISADMKFTIDAVKSDKVETSLKANAELITEVKIIDDKTYQAVLSQVNCAALADFAAFPFLPSHRFQADLSDFKDSSLNTAPDISGGPYLLKEWKADEFVSYTANPTYWKGAPKIPNFILRIIPDSTVLVQAFQAGEVDYGYLEGDLFEQIADKSNLNAVGYPQFKVNFMAMNWADPTDPQSAYDKDGKPNPNQKPHPILSDISVRKALAMGYNKDDILATLGENGGVRMIGFVVPGVAWAYNTDIQPYPYDPEGAKKLLDEAGWKVNTQTGIREKDGVPLKLTIAYNAILKSFETTALIAQDQLKALEIDISVNNIADWPTYLSEVYFGQKYDMTPMSNSHASGPLDPNEFTTLVKSREDVPGGGGNNIASYVNTDVDKLLDDAKTLPGCKASERATLYKQAQQIVHDQVGYEWTFTPNLNHITSKRVGDFTAAPSWGYYGYVENVGEWTLSRP